jgi:hypothetical protein
MLHITYFRYVDDDRGFRPLTQCVSSRASESTWSKPMAGESNVRASRP